MEQKNKNGQEQDLNQLLKVRREKLANLQAEGRDPFQITKFDQTHHTVDAKALYEAHEAELLAGLKRTHSLMTGCECTHRDSELWYNFSRKPTISNPQKTGY